MIYGAKATLKLNLSFITKVFTYSCQKGEKKICTYFVNDFFFDKIGELMVCILDRLSGIILFIVTLHKSTAMHKSHPLIILEKKNIKS